MTRVFGATLILLFVLAAALPAVAAAQSARIRDQDVQQRWQLLTYRDANGKTQSVPAGVGATLQLFSNSAFGEAACSTYDSRYTRSRETLFIDPPDIERFECDPASQAFDDAFYQNLTDTASITVSDSILTLHDSSLAELMTLTRAVIDDDPTVARWDLTRIGTAEGSIEPVIQGLDPWVEFLRGGRLVGNTGCGSFLGSYTINDSTMSINDVAYRLESCTDSARRQAEQVTRTLDEITDFEVLPAGLALRDENGTMRLALAPTLDLSERTWTPIEILN
ncbi:MAG: META domain-containing protein, partial [Chloroflexota bacterium]|nr:META domain-containing protein [Chloroflexota bacterium]